MSVHFSQETRAEIVRRVGDWTSKTPAELDAIAVDYALTLKELQHLLAYSGDLTTQRPRTITQKQLADKPAAAGAKTTPAPVAVAPATEKACTKCKVVQPLTEFHAHPDTRDGKSSQCRSCNSKRQPTVARIVRTRARGRAMYLLTQRYPIEFKQLLEDETRKAIDEHQALQAAAEKRGQQDAAVARLKSGPRRKTETDSLGRLDVARCPQCHQYHDAGHPACVEPLPQKQEHAS